MTKNNRARGNSYELCVINKIKHIFPQAISSRMESKSLDNDKVDICNTGDFYIQCKNMTTKPDYHKIITEMRDGKIKVIFHKLTKKANKNFITQGEYAILKLEDFIKILEQLNNGK